MVRYAVPNGVHVMDLWIEWDRTPKKDWNYYYGTWNWRSAGTGQFIVQLAVDTQYKGKVFYRGFADVDGRFLYAPEKAAPVK